MSEAKPPDPKPPVVVRVKFEYKSERWYSYTFKLEKFAHVLVTYGATQREAEEHLHGQLAFLYGKLGYVVEVMPKEAPDVAPGT